MEYPEEPKKPSLLDKVKGGIRQGINQQISAHRENRDVYKKEKRSAELQAIRAKARTDVAEARGVAFGKHGRATVIQGAKPQRLMDRLNGSPEENAERRKRLYGV
jgi:hypothetical protein